MCYFLVICIFSVLTFLVPVKSLLLLLLLLLLPLVTPPLPPPPAPRKTTIATRPGQASSHKQRLRRWVLRHSLLVRHEG